MTYTSVRRGVADGLAARPADAYPTLPVGFTAQHDTPLLASVPATPDPAPYLPVAGGLVDVTTGERLAWFPQRVLNRYAARLARHAERVEGSPVGPPGAEGARVGPGPQGRASRHYAKYAAAPAQGAVERVWRRWRRYAQREVLWRESSLKRVRNCGRALVGRGGRVAVRERGGVAHYSGVQTCGSVHACPVCQGKVLNERAGDISAATGGWLGLGNSALLAAFTMPHDAPDKLADTLDVVAKGFRHVTGHRAWRRAAAEAGLVGNIRALEHTHWLNGWHPHLHVVFFVRGDVGPHLGRLGVVLRQLWGDCVESRGYRRPDVLHGVDVQLCRSGVEAGLYVAKTDDGRSVGNELARGDLKRGRRGHRTPLELLEDFRQDGDAADLALWREYERATKGRQRITWSPGLRGLLAAEGVELAPSRTDEEIAAAEVGGRVVLLVEAESWRRVTRTPGLAGQLLEVVERGGLRAAVALLAEHGCECVLPPEEEAQPP